MIRLVANPEREDRGSDAIPVHPITTVSAKLQDWLIREAEETLENNIREPKWENGNIFFDNYLID